MLYSEFLKGTRAPETPDTYDQFQIIGQIYEDCEGMTKEEAYRIWKQTYGRELKRRELRQRERLELLINREDYDSADRPHRAAIYHELSTLFWAAYYNKDGSRCRLATEGRCFTDVYGITWILRYDGRYPNGNTILGWYFVVQITRQAGKNEISAFLQHYLLLYGWYFGVPVSGVKFAPVYKPQIQASMDRLEGAPTLDSGGLAGSVITSGQAKVDGQPCKYSKSDGYKFHIGPPRDSNKWAFLSINPTANVASQTAYTLLEGDESQDIDADKWERDAQPMGSFNNATTVLWGVAWTKDSFIYRGELMAHDMEDRLEKELGYRPKLVFKIDAYAVIASGNTNYKKAFDNQVARLGMDHIAIQTQYLLKAVDAIGRFFSAEGVARMYSGGFEMQVEPVKGHKYIWACDVAGQEEETTDVEASVGIHKRDALTFIVGDLLRDGTVVPICLYQWVGKQHSKVRDMLPKIIRYWGAIGGVCDGTGIGEPLAYHLKELFDRNNDGLVEAYKFKAAGDESKSKLGYLAYDFNHNDLIKVPKAPEDPDQLELWKELRWQVEHLTREAKRQQTINFYVPANAEPRKPGHVPHDDLVMALFLLMRAARNIDPNTGKATAFDREKSGV